MIGSNSGATFEAVVYKTCYDTAAKRLYESALKNNELAMYDSLTPLIVKHITEIKYDYNTCTIKTPFIFGNNACQVSKAQANESPDKIYSALASLASVAQPTDVTATLVDKVKQLKIDEELKIQTLLLIEKKPRIIPVGLCHGDLTMANMIFNDGDIHLIDVSTCFIESFVMDVAKLKQEHDYLWTNRFIKDCTDHYKTLVYGTTELCVDLVDEELLGIVSIVNDLRLLPYEKQHSWKMSIIKSVKDKIKWLI